MKINTLTKKPVIRKLSPKPIWLIDIGNSSISVARKTGQKLHKFSEFAENNIPKIIQLIQKSGRVSKPVAVFCSVVPKSMNLVRKHLRHYKHIEFYELGKEIPLSIRSKYNNYNQLGNDRKVNCIGALLKFKAPFVLFDFGTATTAEYVSSSGVFEGGLIMPGVKSCLDLLHEKTALLPLVRIRPIHYFLGRSTRTGMLSGVLHGYGAMVEGLLAEFKRRYGPLKTIATGGLADIILKYCDGFDHVDPLFTLKSMGRIYQDWIDSK